MLKIGLTGGIGTGKSVVARLFNLLGIPVYNADFRARWLMENNPKLVENIKILLGSEVFNENNKPDRKKIAEVVFSNPEALNRLNALIHPAVANDFTLWCEHHVSAPYILKEAAILFESGADAGLDHFILVEAPEDLRIKRVMKRDLRSETEIQAIMKQQWPESKKRERCAYRIVNDDKLAVLPQVIEIDKKLRELTIKNQQDACTA
ncbi:MAG: dephospho-CoA kinase [Sphingobacteriales bacterium]|jgi:dephospho-CoA kinase|nr:dephospho-CoA kinase [Sphingobacteriales bacterium]